LIFGAISCGPFGREAPGDIQRFLSRQLEARKDRDRLGRHRTEGRAIHQTCFREDDTARQFATVSNSGSVLQIGYGEERRYLPSVVRDCRLSEGADDGACLFRCFTNFGYEGAPILAEIDGTPH
jgi:hypothetical protein